MPARNHRLDRARHRSRELIEVTAHELLLGREQTGLSQEDAARAVGLSQSTFGRIERAAHRNLTLDQLCRAAAAVGLRPSLRLYPDGDPVRDIAQTRLLGRLNARIHGSISRRTEVPLPLPGDLRSWDSVLYLPTCCHAVEAETRIRDAQATWRRSAIKLRDDPSVGHVILLVADTPGNRRAIAAVRELLRADLPLDTRAVLAALAAGTCPGANGIVFL